MVLIPVGAEACFITRVVAQRALASTMARGSGSATSVDHYLNTSFARPTTLHLAFFPGVRRGRSVLTVARIRTRVVPIRLGTSGHRAKTKLHGAVGTAVCKHRFASATQLHTGAMALEEAHRNTTTITVKVAGAFRCSSRCLPTLVAKPRRPTKRDSPNITLSSRTQPLP